VNRRALISRTHIWIDAQLPQLEIYRRQMELTVSRAVLLLARCQAPASLARAEYWGSFSIWGFSI
jgi:hypothetical protein